MSLVPLWSAAAVLAAYVATSVTLFFYPTLLHRRRAQAFKVLHGSHRGGAGEQVENTRRAFDHADGASPRVPC